MTRSKKSRTAAKAVGIIALIAFLIGLYTGLPGFSGGDGVKGDASVGDAKTGDSREQTEDSNQDQSEQAESTETVTVLVDNREYFLASGGAEDKQQYTPATLQDIVAKARVTTGDENGLRVIVLRKGSARMSAGRTLSAALRDAGIPDSATYWPEQPVE